MTTNPPAPQAHNSPPLRFPRSPRENSGVGGGEEVSRRERRARREKRKGCLVWRSVWLSANRSTRHWTENQRFEQFLPRRRRAKLLPPRPQRSLRETLLGGWGREESLTQRTRRAQRREKESILRMVRSNQRLEPPLPRRRRANSSLCDPSDLCARTLGWVGERREPHAENAESAERRRDICLGPPPLSAKLPAEHCTQNQRLEPPLPRRRRANSSLRSLRENSWAGGGEKRASRRERGERREKKRYLFGTSSPSARTSRPSTASGTSDSIPSLPRPRRAYSFFFPLRTPRSPRENLPGGWGRWSGFQHQDARRRPLQRGLSRRVHALCSLPRPSSIMPFLIDIV